VIEDCCKHPVKLVLISAILALALNCGQDTKGRIGAIYDAQADPTAENLLKIRGMLDDPDHDVRATAMNVLVGLEVDDAPELALDGLADEHFFVRSIAAKLLADLRDHAYEEVLLERLRTDEHPLVRQRAAEALERLGGEAALEGLVGALSDPGPRINS
jgi:HEAT repeat protein